MRPAARCSALGLSTFHLVARTGNPPTDFTYTGQKMDVSDGLMYYGARYYDAQLGRFISADTIVPSAANPQNLNRYSYVLNNPLRYRDPSGHCMDDGGGNCVRDEKDSIVLRESDWERAGRTTDGVDPSETNLQQTRDFLTEFEVLAGGGLKISSMVTDVVAAVDTNLAGGFEVVGLVGLATGQVEVAGPALVADQILVNAGNGLSLASTLECAAGDSLLTGTPLTEDTYNSFIDMALGFAPGARSGIVAALIDDHQVLGNDAHILPTSLDIWRDPSGSWDKIWNFKWP